MTRRGRLAKLEARRREEGGDVLGIFEADPDAGLWREVNGGRTLPLSPEDVEEAEGVWAAGCGLLIVAPLPGHSKIIPGLTWGDV